jgi:acyl carrier protein
MSDVRERLIKCFCTVFPDLSASEIPRASSGSVDGWDSLATATLLGVVEEEFGTAVDVDDFDALDSFESLLAYFEGAASR